MTTPPVPPSPLHQPEITPSLRCSVRDGVAYSVMAGAGESYFTAFALFLRATNMQVGVLSSFPPLIGSFAQLFSAWLGRRIGARRGIILGGAYLQALSWVLVLGMPLLFPDAAVPVLIIAVTCYYVLGNLINPQWSSLMGDLLPERWRGRFFARRNGIMSVTNFLALVLAGVALHVFEQRGDTYAGFIAVFTVALIARLFSAHYLGRMADPPGRVAKLQLPRGYEWLRRLRGSLFMRFALFFAAMQFAVGIAAPYFAVYMLRDLGLSYLEFMTLTASSVLIQFITLNGWGRISDAFGNRLILVVAGGVIPLLPLLWLVSQNFWYLMFVQFVAGVFWAGFSLSAGNFLYDLVPPEKRVTYLAVHNVLAAVGVFLGVLLGSLAARLAQPLVASETLPYALYAVFAVSSLMRLFVAVIFLPRLKEVRATRRVTAVGLVLRATRSIALAGFVVEFAGARQRRRRNARRAPPAE